MSLFVVKFSRSVNEQRIYLKFFFFFNVNVLCALFPHHPHRPPSLAGASCRRQKVKSLDCSWLPSVAGRQPWMSRWKSFFVAISYISVNCWQLARLSQQSNGTTLAPNTNWIALKLCSVARSIYFVSEHPWSRRAYVNCRWFWHSHRSQARRKGERKCERTEECYCLRARPILKSKIKFRTIAALRAIDASKYMRLS